MMPQTAPNSGWREKMELHLEGGGHLPGASEVVDIRHKVVSCAASRQKNAALVRGELELFVYYRFAGSDRVRGHGARVPWHAEVPLPDYVRGALTVEVSEVKHEHSFHRENEQLDHKIHITFEVWALDNSSSTLPNQRKSSDREVGNISASSRRLATSRYSIPQSEQTEPAISEPSEPKIPDWAKEAAEELLRQQQPVGQGTPPWLHDISAKNEAPGFGQAEGTYTRDGQQYDGPSPEWPRGISFQVIEKALEGEPADNRGSQLIAAVRAEPATITNLTTEMLSINPDLVRSQEGADMIMSQYPEGAEDVPKTPNLAQSDAVAGSGTMSTIEQENGNNELSQPTSVEKSLPEAPEVPAAPALHQREESASTGVQQTESVETPTVSPQTTAIESVKPITEEAITASPATIDPIPTQLAAETQKKNEVPLVWRPFPKTELPK